MIGDGQLARPLVLETVSRLTTGDKSAQLVTCTSMGEVLPDCQSALQEGALESAKGKPLE